MFLNGFGLSVLKLMYTEEYFFLFNLLNSRLITTYLTRTFCYFFKKDRVYF